MEEKESTGTLVEVSSIADRATLIEVGDPLLRCAEVVRRFAEARGGSTEANTVNFMKRTSLIT